jgi:ribulose-phosphate 3-epimerase
MIMRELILSPSILGADYLKLGQQLRILDEAGAQYVHIDVMDGVFVPSISMGMPVIKSLRGGTNRIFDVHLMITEPARYAKEFAEAGADIVTFHLEACQDVAGTIEAFRKVGVKVGLAIKPQTPVEALYPYMSLIDMALVMTVEPGFGGQKLIPETLNKVHSLYEWCQEQKSDVDIQVDGGITLDNFEQAVHAGANILVAGTAVFRGDIRFNTRRFLMMEQELEKSE